MTAWLRRVFHRPPTIKDCMRAAARAGCASCGSAESQVLDHPCSYDAWAGSGRLDAFHQQFPCEPTKAPERDRGYA